MLKIATPEHHEIIQMAEDAKAHFRQNIGSGHAGIMGKWMYSDPHHENDTVCGGLLWDLFTKLHRQYYVTRNQKKVILDNLDDFANALPNVKTIMDFGCGGSEVLTNQTLPLIKAFKSVVEYIPIDMNEDFLRSARNIVSGMFGRKVVVNDVNEDFLKLPSIPRKGQTLGLFFGASTNFERFPDGMVDLLKAFKEAIGKDGYLAMTIDTNQNAQSVIESYTHNLHAEHSVNLMQRFNRDLNIVGDFDAHAWEYQTDVEEMQFNGHDLLLTKHVLVAKRAMSFFIDGEHFTVNKGEEFVADQSYKISVELMDELCSQCGLSRVSKFDDNDNRIALLTYKVN